MGLSFQQGLVLWTQGERSATWLTSGSSLLLLFPSSLFSLSFLLRPFERCWKTILDWKGNKWLETSVSPLDRLG